MKAQEPYHLGMPFSYITVNKNIRFESTSWNSDLHFLFWFSITLRKLIQIIYINNSWHTGLASSGQARRVTDWRRDRRWEMVELKGHQQ